MAGPPSCNSDCNSYTPRANPTRRLPRRMRVILGSSAGPFKFVRRRERPRSPSPVGSGVYAVGAFGTIIRCGAASDTCAKPSTTDTTDTYISVWGSDADPCRERKRNSVALRRQRGQLPGARYRNDRGSAQCLGQRRGQWLRRGRSWRLSPLRRRLDDRDKKSCDSQLPPPCAEK